MEWKIVGHETEKAGPLKQSLGEVIIFVGRINLEDSDQQLGISEFQRPADL